MKNFLKKTFIYQLIINFRVWKAKKSMIITNLYPNESSEIISDYRYSIKKDFRTLMQVINLESCIKHIKKNNIKGAFVETGTWTGGASAFSLLSMMRNSYELTYWGFDSFEGMPQPTENDDKKSLDWAGNNPGILNNADRDSCLEYLLDTGYDEGKINLIKGWFNDTLPVYKSDIGPIAILRLDGDFYESTKVPLTELYSQVENGGIVIIDDYGTFAGCKKAIDEFVPDQDIIYAENGVHFFIKKQ